jgi:ribosomal protein S18 acetylase RimI-like enzyme
MIHLRPMSAEEFAHWRSQTVAPYAADKVRTGRWSEAESLAEAEKELVALLPNGHGTPGHSFFTIESALGQSVGALWVARGQRAAGPIGFIYDLVIWAEHRRRGYASAAMLALEAEALALGFKGLALHVFAHNTSAQQLYARLGYAPTNINMFKPLTGEA